MEILFKYRLPLGKWFGIPVTLHWSWLLMMLASLIFNGLDTFLVLFGVFVIVLMHEFGHCFAGMAVKLSVVDITLLPIGGVARMNVPVKPRDELIVTVCGPLVNAILFVPLYYLSFHPIFNLLYSLNLAILIFNLIPAFPMDGGRILRSFLSLLVDYRTASMIAVRVGQGFGALFALIGIVYLNVWLLLIGVFVLFQSHKELEYMHERIRLLDKMGVRKNGNSHNPIADILGDKLLKDTNAKMDQIEKRLK